MEAEPPSLSGNSERLSSRGWLWDSPMKQSLSGQRGLKEPMDAQELGRYLQVISQS